MIDDVIIERDKITIILTNGDRLYFSPELAQELKIFLNELF